MLNCEWDETKNITNQQKHKISFETAQYVFLDPAAKHSPDRVVDGEERRHVIGKILKIVFVLVVYKKKKGNMLIISARPASRKERILYHGNE